MFFLKIDKSMYSFINVIFMYFSIFGKVEIGIDSIDEQQKQLF